MGVTLCAIVWLLPHFVHPSISLCTFLFEQLFSSLQSIPRSYYIDHLYSSHFPAIFKTKLWTLILIERDNKIEMVSGAKDIRSNKCEIINIYWKPATLFIGTPVGQVTDKRGKPAFERGSPHLTASTSYHSEIRAQCCRAFFILREIRIVDLYICAAK